MNINDYSDETLLKLAELLNEIHYRRPGGLCEGLTQFWQDILTELEERPERPIEIEHLDEIYAYDA